MIWRGETNDFRLPRGLISMIESLKLTIVDVSSCGSAARTRADNPLSVGYINSFNEPFFF